MPIQIKNGTRYHKDCPAQVIRTLEEARLAYNMGRGYRLRIYYGDPTTGKWWGDIEAGYIGRSVGPKKIPILIYNKLSRGGTSILDNFIVKIEYANKRQGGVLFDVIRHHEETKEQPARRIH